MRRERRSSGVNSLGQAEPHVTPAAAGTDGGPLVSVVVVCWNAADVLRRCLEGLFAQDYANREIVVVDDGSDDATAEVAQDAAARGELSFVRSPRNRGCPSARNLGLAHVSGEIVAFIDADGFATPQWLGEVVKAFGEDPQIGGIASTVFFDDNPMVINGAGGIVNRQGWAADLSMNESYEDASLAAEALYPMGCGMAIRREALARVGPFDDQMLNYYDDVDYGTRLWRAGYRVAVAADAWIDHGFGAAGGDSARKRLLCERHRMRVVLKHAPARSLAAWARWEARDLRSATMAVRVQKLRSIGWNAGHLASVLASRWALRGAPSVCAELLDPSYGDGFPVGVPLHLRPAPERAGASVEMARPDVEGQLLHGWFPVEHAAGRSYRWAATKAAALVRLDQPAKRLRLDYVHVPVDMGGVELRVRRVGSAEPLATVWQTRLAWQYLARSVENHPLELEPGDYEVTFASARGWSDPPRETRSLAFALSALSFEGSFEIPSGSLDMASPAVEEQLVAGWFEPEERPDRRYRWATGRAAAVVRLTEPAIAARVNYCLPPGPIGSLSIELSRLDERRPLWSTRIAWRDADWHEERVALDLVPGDYLVAFEVENTWANPEGSDGEFSAENRQLGFALSSLSFDGL